MEELVFHPSDTVIKLKEIEDIKIDQLWYKINYSQQKSLDKKENERLHKLRENVKLNDNARNIIKQRRVYNKFSLIKIAKTHEVKLLKGIINGKIVHGLGTGHIRETSITLHPLYGVPYIPGSSIKGVLRNWIIQAFFKGNEKKIEVEEGLSEQQLLVRNIFFDLFGNQKKRGLVQFYDAFVDEDFEIRPDVLTVHFKDYYSNSNLYSPIEDDGKINSPNPVEYYALKSTEFEFMVSIQKKKKEKNFSELDSSQLLELTINWLKTALSEQGIGSKTASGYGYFDELMDITDEALEEYKTNITQFEAKKKRKEEEDKKAELEKKKLDKIKKIKSQMSPANQLAFDIQNFDIEEQTQILSKSEKFIEKISDFAKEGELAPAKALQDYWCKIGAWKVKKNKKQYQKVLIIKEILSQ